MNLTREQKLLYTWRIFSISSQIGIQHAVKFKNKWLTSQGVVGWDPTMRNKDYWRVNGQYLKVPTEYRPL